MVISHHHHPPFHIHHGNHGKMVGWSDSFPNSQCLFFHTKEKAMGFLMDGNWESYFQPLSHGKDSERSNWNSWLPPQGIAKWCVRIFNEEMMTRPPTPNKKGSNLPRSFIAAKKKAGNWKESKELQCLSLVIQLVLLWKSNHWMCLNDRTEIDFLSSHSHWDVCCQGQHEQDESLRSKKDNASSKMGPISNKKVITPISSVITSYNPSYPFIRAFMEVLFHPIYCWIRVPNLAEMVFFFSVQQNFAEKEVHNLRHEATHFWGAKKKLWLFSYG